jgi:ribonuclease PH
MPKTKAPERAPLSRRPVKIQLHPIKYAEGSALITVGNTRVLCAATVEPGKPRWMGQDKRGWITAEYSLLPRSTTTRTRRERGNVSGRTQEIQRLIGRSLRAVADLSRIDNYTITVDCDVLQADGGTRTAAITGGYVALHAACAKLMRDQAIKDFPLHDQVAAISCGIYQGELWLDLDYQHDFAAEVDMNVVMTGSGQICEIQGTAESKPFSRQTLNQMVEVASRAIRELIIVQKQVLKIK